MERKDLLQGAVAEGREQVELEPFRQVVERLVRRREERESWVALERL